MDALIAFKFNNTNVENNLINGAILGDSAENVLGCSITTKTNIPWEDIPSKKIKGCNILFTLCPDPNNFEGNHNNLKFMTSRLLNVLKDMMNAGFISKAVVVHEWGERGKQYGKLHYHGVVKTTGGESKLQFEKMLLDSFNKRTNQKHITLDNRGFRSIEDRSRWIDYMKKEFSIDKKGRKKFEKDKNHTLCTILMHR